MLGLSESSAAFHNYIFLFFRRDAYAIFIISLVSMGISHIYYFRIYYFHFDCGIIMIN